MPPLAELQRGFALAVMGGEAPAALFMGAVPFAEALNIHRDTIMAALVNALRISYPSVDALVGEQFFDQTCLTFVEVNPPRAASLAEYGAGFADFLADFAPAAALAYLPDVARLDRAVETALRASAATCRFALDAAISIELPRSLAVLRLTHRAHDIRAALGDDAALAAIDPSTAECFVAVWRKGLEAAVLPVEAAAGHFLTALLAGEGSEAALATAMAATDEAAAINAIQTGIFAASFCTVISNPEELSP